MLKKTWLAMSRLRFSPALSEEAKTVRVTNAVTRTVDRSVSADSMTQKKERGALVRTDTEEHQDKVDIRRDAYGLTNKPEKEKDIEKDKDDGSSDRLYPEELGVVEIRRGGSHF